MLGLNSWQLQWHENASWVGDKISSRYSNKCSRPHLPVGYALNMINMIDLCAANKLFYALHAKVTLFCQLLSSRFAQISTPKSPTKKASSGDSENFGRFHNQSGSFTDERGGRYEGGKRLRQAAVEKPQKKTRKKLRKVLNNSCS